MGVAEGRESEGRGYISPDSQNDRCLKISVNVWEHLCLLGGRNESENKNNSKEKNIRGTKD